MSTHRSNRSVADAIAAGEAQTNSSGSFRFDGRFVWSYAEPIAMVHMDQLLVTTAKFSMTTSHHTSQAAAAWAISRGARYVDSIPHGTLRQHVRDAGLALGRYGAKYDADYTPRTNIALGATR